MSVRGEGWVPPYSLTIDPWPGSAVTITAPQRNLRVAVEVRDGKTRVFVSVDGVLVRSVECVGDVAIEEVL